MITNKLTGLKFLKKTFSKQKEIGVLPWRVYSKPWQVMPGHFKDAERILVRTDLKAKEIPEGVWSSLPRKDSTKSTLKQTMKKMHADYTGTQKKNNYKTGFRYITHSVESREKAHYPGVIQFEPNKEGKHDSYIAFSKPDNEDTIWREFNFFVKKIEEKEFVLKKMKNQGHSEQHAEKAYAALVKAIELIKKKAEKKFFGPNKTITASFTINDEEKVKQGKPIIEFYDIISKKGLLRQ